MSSLTYTKLPKRSIKVSTKFIRYHATKTTESDSIHTHTIKTPVGIKAAIAALKPKTTRLSIEGPIECDLRGFQLLNSPIYNKGSAFTIEERQAFGLTGLLPSQVNTLDEQVERAYQQFQYLKTPLAKNDFCTSMRIQNKVLYYELVRRHIREMLPIIYTPTEGDAIANYSHRFRKPEGCFLDINDPDSIDERLSAYGEDKDIDYIVMSDGEGILGIGDQGVGGIRIAIAKLGLMTLCGGIHPGRVLPIALDVGSNNEDLVNDDLYMGNKFARVRGEQYWNFIDKVIHSIKNRFPNAVLHYEDFGVTTGRTMLTKYRSSLPSFNDDIQGTGAVVMASMTAALKFSNRDLLDSKVLIYGAGSAGIGVADQIVNHMVSHGCSKDEAYKKIHIMDRRGVILQSMEANEGQKPYVDDDADWEGIDTSSLVDAVRKVQPTVLVGCSTKAGAFTEEVIKEMYKHNSQPIVFPLSNPTRLHEAFPVDIMKWTDNNALIATGSPFAPVDGHYISENNNCFTFPGIGLGAVLSRCNSISDTMVSAAVDQLAKMSPKMDDPKNGLLPRLEEIDEVSAHVATAVILQALKENNARVESEERPNGGGFVQVPREYNQCLKWVQLQMWKPIYRPLVKVKHVPEIHTYQS